MILCSDFKEFRTQLQQLAGTRRVVAVIDNKVEKLYGEAFPFEKMTVVAEERHKTMQTVETLIQRLLELHADRDVLLLGVGGGITTDICGFVASIYKRGVACGLVPTTLLGMVDASIGGKNGVNMLGYKNMLGTIRQPEFVVSTIDFLSTLETAEVRQGLAEMLKAFLIKGEYFEECGAFFANNGVGEMLEDGTKRSQLQTFIQAAVAVKEGLVREDEQDNGVRRLLNLGHTFGHALERCTGMAHGDAVAIGMVCAAKCANSADTPLITEVLQSCGLPVEVPAGVSRAAMLEAMMQDKKRADGRCRVVVLEAVGRVEVREMELQELRW
jgi:3-dehydroquinate synthase